MAPSQRFTEAFLVTKELGIADDDVKPVLKKLLKVFDGNWELIAAENHRALIDAYFESNDCKEETSRKRGPDGCDELGNPPKRLQTGELESQVSSTQDNSRHKRQQESQSSLRDKCVGGSQITRATNCDKGKKPIGYHSDSIGVKSSSHKASSAAYLKQPQEEDESCSAPIQRVSSSSSCRGKELVKPTTDLSLNNSRNHPEPTAITYRDTDNRKEGSACNNRRSWKSNIDITSSASGDVKLILKCHSPLEQRNFQHPDLDVVLKFLEDKYIRSYKIVQPQFSMMNLLKDLCESFVELGTDSIGRSNRVKSSPRVAISSQNPLYNIGPKRGASSSSCIPEESKSDRKSLNSHNAGIQQPIVPKKPLRSLKDISRGSENVEISLVDEIGSENLPKFTYIPQNIVYQNAFPNISLARISDHDCCSRCSGDCLSSIPCECAAATGGEFAYTEQGLLKEEFLANCLRLKEKQDDMFYCPKVCPIERTKNEYKPERCKGHLVRKFIKECWTKCGCNMKCGNRIVQRGITCKLEVFMTPEGKGWGVRTLQDLPKGTFVCEYVGEILTNMELYERNLQSSGDERHTYPVTLDADWGSEGVLKDEEALCLDATIYGNVARFINHRCFDANLFDIPVEVENPDHHYYHVAFFTKRDIKALEELTWDYGIDFYDHDHPIEAFECSCQSTYCRGTKQKGNVQISKRR